MGVITGFTDLDHILKGGLQKGCLYVLAARPSIGKTTLAIHMADYICLKEHRTVAFFSLENSRRQVIDRILALESGIDPYCIFTGRINRKDWHRIAEAAETIGKSNLVIDDSYCIDVHKLRTRCLEYRRENEDLAAIFIDYLQLISGSEEKESREEEALEVVTSLKDLARELDRPIVVLSQISRSVEHREDHRPTLSDFFPGKTISQYFDGVMFLYRDEYYNKDSERKGIAEVIVAKNPMGPVGVVELGYQAPYVKFTNFSFANQY